MPVGPALKAMTREIDRLRSNYRQMERRGLGGGAEGFAAQVAEVLHEVNVSMSKTFQKP